MWWYKERLAARRPLSTINSTPCLLLTILLVDLLRKVRQMILVILAIVPLEYFLFVAHRQVINDPIEPEFRVRPKDVSVRDHGLCIELRFDGPLCILLLVRDVH